MNKEDKIELAQWAQGFESRLARLSRKVESASLSPASLRFASVDAEGGISFKDEYGNVIYKLGRGDSGMVEPEYFGGPDPERPEAPFVDYGGEVVKIQHSGLDEHEEQGPADYLRTLIYLSQEAEFETGLDTYAGSFSEIDGTMTHRLPGGTWFIAVQWETRSHKLSGLSEAVEVEVPPLVDEQDIQDALDEAQARLDEVREEFEQMNQERVDAIQDLNDVVLPALEQSLTEAMTELEERVGDVDLSHLESALAELNETRLPALEETLAGKAESSELPALEGRLTSAFGEDLDAAVTAAAEDATAKANAAQEAAEAEAGRLAKAEAQAAKSAAEQAAAQDALDKANAARDAAIESASDDAQEKADAAKEAAETAATADAKAKADAAQAEAIRQAALDATAKADAAKTAAENAAKDYADQQDVILKGEAAADAQEKADAARSEAISALQSYARDGINLLYNGSFEQGWDGWGVTSGEIIKDPDARTGDHVAVLGRPEANHYPRHDWVATEKGRVYLVEYWAKRLPGGTDPQPLRIYYQVDRRGANITGAYAVDESGGTLLMHASDMPENEWVKISGLVEVTHDHASEIRFSPHVTRTDLKFHIDDVTAFDVTAARGALLEAREAYAEAQSAHKEAGDAWDHADAAMTRAGEAEDNAKGHADNMPKVLHGTGAPSGTAPDGSIWWQHQGSLQGAVAAQWNRVDGSWASTPISSEAIANLDVGKLTAGGAVISDAVIQDLTASNGAFDRLDAREGWVGGVALEDGAVTARTVDVENVFTSEAVVNTLWADRIQARVAELSSLIVATGNMIPNGDLTQGDQFWSSDITFSHEDTPPGYATAGRSEPGAGTVHANNTPFPLEGGKEYLFEGWFKADLPGSNFFLELRDQDGEHASGRGELGSNEGIGPHGRDERSYLLNSRTLPTEWTRYETIVRVNEGVTSGHLREFHFNHHAGTEQGATISFGGLRMVPRVGAEVIVDGAITTRHLVAEAVKAANIDVQSLVADEAFVNTVWADVVRAGLLTAEEALIGGALLQNGIIDADKINAESVTAAVAQFLEIEAGMITANAFEGGTFTGGTFEGTTFRGGAFETHAAADRGVKFNDLGTQAFDQDGGQTLNISAQTGDVEITGEVTTKAPGRPGLARIGPAIVPGGTRPGVTFDTGDDSAVQPTIFGEAETFSGSWEEGSLALIGRETTANTGRSELTLKPDGQASLQIAHGPHGVSGYHIIQQSGEVGLAAVGPYVSAHARSTVLADRSGTSSGNGDVKWTLTYAAPVPYGTRIVEAVPYSSISSSFRTGKVGINHISAGKVDISLTNKSSGGTWSVFFWAWWLPHGV